MNASSHLLLALSLWTGCLPGLVRAGFQTFPTADFALGRTADPQTTFWQPGAVAVDPVSKKVFVCDTLRHRVLRFPATASLTSQAVPEAVFGQAGLTGTGSGSAAAQMNRPVGIALDPSGRLWVADGANNRVLRFDAAGSLNSGAAAHGVLGQAGFGPVTATPSASRLASVSAVAVFGSELYVADRVANRVLLFLNAAGLADGAAAQKVFGQPDFTSSASGLTSGSLSSPAGLAVQSDGGTRTLWVADRNNHRVLGFSNAQTGSVSAPATQVLGQTSFTANATSRTASGMNEPTGLSFAGDSLYAADGVFSRVMRYDAPHTGSPGKPASMVYGQDTFTSAVDAPDQPDRPMGICVDAAGALWVADQRNDRVLRYDNSATKSLAAPYDFALWPTTAPGAKIDAGGIAIEPFTGKVFVSDSKRNRVLRYAGYKSLGEGSQPEAVLGQPDFSGVLPGISAASMSFPRGLSCSLGRLWVADTENNRVLRFDQAAFLPSGSPADAVLGQPDFTTRSAATTASSMRRPAAVAWDSGSLGLWVADTGNHRVLRFDSAVMLANGANASGLLGQFSFLGNSAQTTDRFMNSPTGLAPGASGRLWVMDSGNGRVLRFENAGAKPTWAPADGVLGQPDFSSAVTAVDATHLSPYGSDRGLAVDTKGRLYVNDNVPGRTLWYSGAALKPNGAAADGVLGQPDFTATDNYFDLKHFNTFSTALVVDPAGGLWVCDPGYSRVLHFPSTTPAVSNYGLDGLKHFFLSVATTPGGVYQMERTTDLNTWTPVGGAIATGTTSLFFLDSVPPVARRSYRIRELAP